MEDPTQPGALVQVEVISLNESDGDTRNVKYQAPSVQLGIWTWGGMQARVFRCDSISTLYPGMSVCPS